MRNDMLGNGNMAAEALIMPNPQLIVLCPAIFVVEHRTNISYAVHISAHQ